MNSANEMNVEFDSIAKNESFARVIVASFITSTNPTLEEVSDIKTAVSEAVTNAIIHGYENKQGKICIRTVVKDRSVYIEVIDRGVGIRDIKQAMEPLFTTKPEEERSGMGFSFMEAFMDRLEVESEMGKGTVVKMWKEIGAPAPHYD
ncbi:anti-sigma F factor [Eubacterium sp. MSJ-33]|uniref:anti-sigma F factor n=1 Tax=Eubacterium sp. MSJ-33 TaxID=2841528 RepID=UPI0015AE0BC4|nr:anti-sigma F factor [Eubacterium sp. MSJ-33]QWT53918.1 anti-sigma F factor [Eubacterium sp. MSJ-33]